MNQEILQAIDTELIPVHPLEGNIQGITDFKARKTYSILFIKDKKIYQELLHTSKFFQKEDRFTFIIEGKFFEIIKETIEFQTLMSSHHYGVFISPDVMESMCKLSHYFYHRIRDNEVDGMIDGRQLHSVDMHPTAFIAQGVFIGSRVKIGAFVKIYPGSVIHSDVEIGDYSIIYSNSTLYPGVVLKNHVRIHSGTVVGADGFGYHFKKGVHHKIWHLGGVIIEDHVEIGANSCIDSGTFSPTVIQAGSKIDNHVQVGHNCFLGPGVILCGQVAVGGSTSLGAFTVVGGQAGFANGLKIGNAVNVAGGAGVISNLEDKEVVGGFPARNIKEWLSGIAYLRKLSLQKVRKNDNADDESKG